MLLKIDVNKYNPTQYGFNKFLRDLEKVADATEKEITGENHHWWTFIDSFSTFQDKLERIIAFYHFDCTWLEGSRNPDGTYKTKPQLVKEFRDTLGAYLQSASEEFETTLY